MSATALRNILPDNYNYDITEEFFTSVENFKCVLRIDIANSELFMEWLLNFQAKTDTTWILRSSVSDGRFEFSRDYVCQHSAFNKKGNMSAKNKECGATLKVRIKRNTKNIRYQDEYVRKGLRGIVTIDCRHSHPVGVSEASSWLKRSPETVEIFIDYFNRGMTPAAAKRFHEDMIGEDDPDLLSNSRVNPPVRWVYRLHDKWREEIFERTISEAEFS